MRPIRLMLVIVLLAGALCLPTRGAAQDPQAPGPPVADVQPPAEPDVVEPGVQPPVAPPRVMPQALRRAPVLRIGQDYALRDGEAVREAMVIYGTATIDGRVDGDLVVVLGTARLSSTASIGGSLVVVGGSAIAESDTQLRDVLVVGGNFDGPPGFSAGGQHVVIGPTVVGGNLEAVVPWVTRGLLWGRPIVPDVPWIWAVVGVFFLVYLGLSVVFEPSVRACALTLASKPLTAFAVGLLVMLLTGPVSLLLMVSVIGIAVVPFVLCALFAAWVIGRVGVLRWIGMKLMLERAPESRLQPLRSLVLGFAVITIAYIVPVLGFIVFTIVGVFGLGAAALAFITAFRQENPPGATAHRQEVHQHPQIAVAVTGGGAPVHASYVPEAHVPERSDMSYPDPLPAAHGATAPLAGPPGPLAPPPAAVDLASFPRAAFRERLAAFVLDVILVVIAVQLLNLINVENAVFLLLLGYHIGFWVWKGTTVGGIICQLRVVRVDGAPLRFVDALVRGLSSIFSLAVLGLGALWILKDPEGQAWHDKIAGTYVVKVPRNWPL